MKNILFIKVMVLLFPFVFFQNEKPKQPAFPGAEGFGAYAKGGRGGTVLIVDNLNDDGPGSIRAAIGQNAARTIVFRISGNIELKTPLIIRYPFLTIAGQTAPGDGICLKNFPLVLKGTHDVVIRNIKVRPGIETIEPGKSSDALEIRDSENIIIDHCSFSWGTDELMNTWHGTKNITIQWCIFSEPLNNSVHPKGSHGYAASIGGIQTFYHHNLIANAPGRNPSIAGQDTDSTIALNFCNNVVFNWEHRTCDGKPVSINFSGNYYKLGPATMDVIKKRLVRIDNCDKYGYSPSWYIENNYLEGFPEISADNWAGGIEFEEGISAEKNRSLTPFANAGYISEDPVLAYKKVLENAGALPKRRDAVDKRIIAEARSGIPTFGNGIIDKVEQAGGWPILKATTPLEDSDNDGIPDEWERKNKLDPYSPDDRNFVSEKTGYTALENYLNELMAKN